MMSSDEMLVQITANAIAEMSNITAGHHRPIFLAAVRMSVEAAVATLSPAGRAAYEESLERMEVQTIKRPKRKGRECMASLGYETNITQFREWCLENGVELIAFDMPKECATRLVMRDPLNRRTVERQLYGWEPLGQLSEQVLADMLAELRDPPDGCHE